MGLPGSGKSTLTDGLTHSGLLRNTLLRLTQLDFHIESVSFDAGERAKRLELNCVEDRFDPVAWKSVRKELREKVELIRSKHHAVSSGGILLLLDDNFQYKSMRKNFRPNGIIYLNRRLDLCVSSNENRVRPVPLSVIEHMALSLEQPEETGYHPVLNVDVADSMDPDHVLDFVVSSSPFWNSVLESALRSPTSSELPVSNITDREKALNACETRLRKCVAAYVSKRRIGQQIVKYITHIKFQYLREFKALIPANDLNVAEIEEEMDSVTLRFSRDLGTLD